MPKTTEKVIATLEMVVEYEEFPDKSDLEEVVEKARELGHVAKALLTIHRATITSLI